jgi:glycolate oxidase FAD binding subunit
MSSEVASLAVAADDEPIERVEEPTTTAELCELLADLHRAKASVLVCGGRTRLAFGNVGGPFDVAISTAQLNQVIHYEPDDMTLAVQAGCTIAQLQALLASHGQQLALDVAHAERATLGGSYATGLSGPRRLSAGSLKDWIIGVEVAGADGVIAKAGGMVVKNVTGFDMMHLHYGALGAFGVVTRINLKVFPRPGAERSIRLGFGDAARACDAGVAVLRSQLQPSSLLVSNDDGWWLYVRCDAPQGAIERVVQRVIDVAAGAARTESVSVMADGADALVPFTVIANLRGSNAVARLSVGASRQRDVLTRLPEEFGWQVCADLGSGLVYVAAAPSPDWIAALRAIEPRATLLAAPAAMKRGIDVFGGLDEANATIVRRLRDEFDPGRRLNRGRFVLGL